MSIGFQACKKDPKPELSATPLSLNFAAADDPKPIEVKSNTDWTITGQHAWLTLSAAAGKGNAIITVTAQANTPTARNAELTIAAKGATPVKINVTQAAAPPPVIKTVSVGAQVVSVIAGENKSVTFPLTTTNIANDVYSVGNSVTNLPAGVTLHGNIEITGGNGEFSLWVSPAAVAGTYSNLTLTIDGTTSAAFTLTITAAAEAKTVSVGAQVGTLTTGVAETVTFPVTTTNIANGSYPATVANRPAGVTVSGNVTISGNSGTLTLAGNTSTVVGTTNTLTLTIDGTTSAAFTLTIAEVKTVSVGAQAVPVTAGENKPVTFPFTTTNIANGVYSFGISAANLPAGVTLHGNIEITGGNGEFSLWVSPTAAAGTYTNLTLTIDGTTSSVFTLTISAVLPVITINTQPAPSTTVTAGSISSSLTVAASVTLGATVSYQWYSNTSASNTGGTSLGAGAGNATFPIPTGLTAAGSPYYYYCVVSATGGATSVPSNVVTVTVNPAAVPVITINTQPSASTTVTQGSISGSLTIAASVTLGATVSYQWYSNTSASNSGGTIISGAINANFTIPTTLTAAESPYYYYCVVSATSGAASVRSNVATVTVTPPSLPAINITSTGLGSLTVGQAVMVEKTFKQTP